LLDRYGTIPKAIISRPNSNIGYMIDLLNKLNIEIREVKNLHIIPEIKKELYEY
jgi:hypothetical protein